MDNSNTITISTLGSCITRDIFRICDCEHRFKTIKNIGFISPISIFSSITEPIEELKNEIKELNIPNFQKRNLLLDLEGGAFPFVCSARSDYLIMDLVDLRLPVMKRGDDMVTIRDQSTEATMTRQYLAKRGYKFTWINEFTIEELIVYLDMLCNNLKKYWDPDHIILIESRGTRCIRGRHGFIEKNAFFDQKYDDYFDGRMGILRKLNDYVYMKLKCHYIQMPPMQYVMGDICHTFGTNPLHYTNKVYEYFYDRICTHIIKEGYQSKLNVLMKELKHEYYDAYNGTLVTNIKKPLSEAVLDCLATISCGNYLERLVEIRDCVVIISVRDTAGFWFNADLQKKMEILGLKENLIKKLMIGYVAVIKDGVVIYEGEGENGIEYESQIDYLTLSIKSRPFKKGNLASIYINGIDYAVNKRGLNIVLFDLIRGNVVDSVVFDTHVSQFNCTRVNKYLSNEDVLRVDIKNVSNKMDLIYQTLRQLENREK